MSRLRTALVALVALAALAAAACSVDGPEDVSADALPAGGPAPALPVTVASADGRQVTVADASRIVPLFGNIAEVVFDLGLGDRVVGRDVSATFEDASHLPVVTRAHDVSAESVLSLRPTLVLADEDTGPPEALEHLRNVGVPVVVFERPTSVDDVDDRIVAIADALGVASAGAALAEQTLERLDAVRAKVPEADPLRVAFLYLRGTASVYLLGGPGAGTDSLIELAGGTDAGTAIGLHDPFTPITSEAMADAAPDVLLVTTSGLSSVGGIDGLASIPGVAQTPAGRDRRVVTLEDGLLFSFGSRTPEALASLIEQLHGS